MTADRLPDLARLRRLAWLAGVPSRLVDDAAQEALLRIWAKRDRIDPASNVDAWMVRVAMNVARSYARRERRRNEELGFEGQEDAEGTADDRAGPEEQARLSELSEVLEDLLAQVAPARRRVFIEHELHARSASEIAEAHGIPTNTVKSRLRKAWQEITAASERWNAVRQRRGWGKLFALLPAWPSMATALGPGAKLAVTGAGVAAIVAALALPIADTPLPPEGAPVAPPEVPWVRAAARSDPPPAARALANVVPGARPGPARAPSASLREVDLLHRASVALDSGDLLEAARLLDEHRLQFPEGHLDAARQGLRRRMR